jgi:hypothetical protein
LRFGSKAKATRHSPPAARKRNSLMLAWRDPFSVSHAGTPQPRSEPLEKARQCQNLRLHLLVQRVELRLKRIADCNNPARAFIWHAIHIMSNLSRTYESVQRSYITNRASGGRRFGP